jgi:hypothetical protein
MKKKLIEMKHNTPAKYFVWILFLFVFNFNVKAQDEKAEPQQIVNFHYYNKNNSLQYLQIESLLKTGKKSEPQARKVFQLYLDSNKAENLITKVLTDKMGRARAVIPLNLKDMWDGAAAHTFIVVAERTMPDEDEPTYEFPITKAKIQLDTSTIDGVRNITASVMKLEDSEWVPAADVEMKVGIRRMDNIIISANDEPTYTTDSTGTVTVEMKKDSLPGDVHGNMVLAASVEDNEELGNLLIEKTVSWGVPLKVDKTFFSQRSLWATRFRTPYWLLTIAYSMAIGIWAVIVYLVVQIIKIKKLGASQ